MVRGERRSELKLLITEENADVARDFVRTGVEVPDLSKLYEAFDQVSERRGGNSTHKKYGQYG